MILLRGQFNACSAGSQGSSDPRAIHKAPQQDDGGAVAPPVIDRQRGGQEDRTAGREADASVLQVNWPRHHQARQVDAVGDVHPGIGLPEVQPNTGAARGRVEGAGLVCARVKGRNFCARMLMFVFVCRRSGPLSFLGVSRGPALVGVVV